MLIIKFSKPIAADTDAYYMSIPEVAAEHISKRLEDFESAVELCSAVGMLCIILSKYILRVVGIDNDPQRISDAESNARLYERDNVQFTLGDVLDEKLLASLKANVAVLDPDWSAKNSDKTNHMLNPDDMQPDLRQMMRLTRRYITKNLVVRLPKGFTHEILAEFGPHELEDIYIDGEIKFKVAYFLQGISKNKSSSVKLGSLKEST